MKRVGRFLITLVLLAVVISVMAQNDQNALRDVVEQNTYGDNWFISLGGSANLLTSEQDGAYFKWSDRVKYGGELTVGKWFNPNYGARLQFQYGGLSGFNFDDDRGGWYVHNSSTWEKYPIAGSPNWGSNKQLKYVNSNRGKWNHRGFLQQFNYASATFDLMSNFTNLMRGRYYDRGRWDVIGFAGLGIIHAFDNGLTNPDFWHFAAKVGLRVNYNITNDIAVYLESQGTLTQQEFDGYRGTGDADGFARLSLGVQYTFNKKFNTLSDIVRLTADEVDRLNRKINNNRYLIENQQDILERQQNLLDKLEKCCEENPKEVVTHIIESGCLPEYVRFGLDSYKIEPTELRKIAEVVDYLKLNPNSKLLVVGYADRQTGNPRYNLNLSQKRVEVVAAELRRLGIDSSRIISEFKGDREQPFPQNEWNRVVIMVERK